MPLKEQEDLKPKTLICTATKLEQNAITKALQTAGLENQFDVLATGMGFVNASRKLSWHLKKQNIKPNAIISLGFAGGSKAMHVGDWVEASRIFKKSKDEYQPLNISLNRCFTTQKVHSTDLICMDELFHEESITNPQNLPWDMNAPWAVDMESAVYAEIASEHNIPFHCLRMVSDTPQNKLPDAFVHWTEFSKANDSFSKSFISFTQAVTSFLTHPKVLYSFITGAKKLSTQFSNGWAEILHSNRNMFTE